MWANIEFPFIDPYCLEHGSEELFTRSFNVDGDLLPDAPQQLHDEVAAIRDERDPDAPAPRDV